MRREEKWLLGAGIVVSTALLGAALFGRQGVPEVRRLRAERARVLEELETLRIQEQMLWRQISALRDDPRAVERYARERLGMVRKGEVVFLIPRSDDPPR